MSLLIHGCARSLSTFPFVGFAFEISISGIHSSSRAWIRCPHPTLNLHPLRRMSLPHKMLLQPHESLLSLWFSKKFRSCSISKTGQTILPLIKVSSSFCTEYCLIHTLNITNTQVTLHFVFAPVIPFFPENSPRFVVIKPEESCQKKKKTRDFVADISWESENSRGIKRYRWNDWFEEGYLASLWE